MGDEVRGRAWHDGIGQTCELFEIGLRAGYFLRECPVSARYLGEMNGFAAAARAAGIDFCAVLSSPRRTWADAHRLRADSRPLPQE